jgi:cytochrome c oxidase subunit 3
MSAVSPPGTLEKLKSGQGYGGPHPPEFGGGGDRGPGDGQPDYEHRLHRARLGLLLGVISITGLFVTLTLVLLLGHSNPVFDPQSQTYVSEWKPMALPTGLLLWNTFILLLSSLTAEMARRASVREILLAPVHAIAGIAPDREWGAPWLALTVVLGLVFLGGQWMAWETVRLHGFHISTNGMSPFFYLLTGAHAIHLTVGIMVLLYAAAISILRLSLEHRRIVTEIAGWYWHFMGVLWMYILVLLELGR